MSFVHFAIPLTGSVRPCFIVCVLYFWAIYRPTLLPALLIFIFGIIYDLFLDYPLALHALMFLITFMIVKKQRLFFLGQSYIAIWLGFILTSGLFLIVEYLFFSLIFNMLLPLLPLLGSFLLTVIAFPLLSYIFIKINNILPIPLNPGISVD